MKCQFCNQEVENPCQSVQEMQQRALSHIARCENALKAHKGAGSGTHARDVRSR